MSIKQLPRKLLAVVGAGSFYRLGVFIQIVVVFDLENLMGVNFTGVKSWASPLTLPVIPVIVQQVTVQIS